jgi:hypothetical protein
MLSLFGAGNCNLQLANILADLVTVRSGNCKTVLYRCVTDKIFDHSYTSHSKPHSHYYPKEGINTQRTYFGDTSTS